jgi:uncharacterized membrane protein (DUF2068 family)
MTPQDHNKTLGIIYGFLGGLLTVAALVELIRVLTMEKELERIRSSTELQVLIPVGLLLTVFLLLIAYGLLKMRPWARMLALISTALFVWLFPLGTALAIYSWFLHSKSGKHIYTKPSL